jgi:hypothetical protein
MPTLDDLPIMPAIGLAALASGDLVAVYDVGDSASSKIKKVTVAEIGVVTANAILATGSYAFNGLAANQVVSGAANATMAITANTRLIVVASGTTSGVVLNPPTTATTRELFIMNGGSGACSVTAATNCIVEVGGVTPDGTASITAGAIAHFLCDGTNWYRVQ